MSWSTLQRKTPLRAKTGFKTTQGFKRKQTLQQPNDNNKVSQKDNKLPTRAKTERNSLTVRLDIVFSLFIRLRDAMPGGRTRCISCGKEFSFEQMQCGHFHSRRCFSTRWDEDNCSSQCVECNCDKSGNIDCYAPNLIIKIGQARFDALRVRANQTKKLDDSELRGMIRHYTAEIRRLSKDKDINVKI